MERGAGRAGASTLWKSKYIVLFNFMAMQSALAQTFSIDNDTYSLDYADGQLAARSGTVTSKGEKMAEDENFSQWSFNDHGRSFEIIYNSKTKHIIDVKPDADTEAGGPFFIVAKGKYLLIDYGTGPDPTPFVLVDENGSTIYKDQYWGDWPIGYTVIDNKLYLEYVAGKMINDPNALERCGQTTGGDPVQLEIKYANIKNTSDLKIEETEYIACTQ